MSIATYEFDPCKIDGSDKEVTLDNWKPSAKTKNAPNSEWRQKQNDGKYNLQPGIDDLKKIMMYLKRKYPDHEIMNVFGISCETLVAIKRNCYSPIEGISLDNQSKIYNEFTHLDKKLEIVMNALIFLSENIFSLKDSAKCKSFKAIISTEKKKKSTGNKQKNELN